MEKNSLRYLWSYVRIFKYFFLLIIFLTLLSQICGQFYPYFLAKIYDTAAKASQDADVWERIFAYAFWALALGLGEVLLFEATMFIDVRFFPQARTIVIRDAFDYVNRHSISYFNNEMSGNISNKVSQLNNGVLEFFNFFQNIAYSSLHLFVTVLILGFINLWFLLALSVWLLLVAAIGLFMGRKRSQYSKETSTQQSIANGMIVDSLANYSEIKSFANFKFERYNLLRYLRLLRKAETREQKIRALIHLSLNLITVISMLLFMFLSILMLKFGQINTVSFIYANTLFMTIAPIVFEITWMSNNVSRTLGQLDSALSTIAVEPEIVDMPGARKLQAKKCSIVFDNVSFAYKGKDNLFNGLNLEIKPGEKVGLVGTSGAGKSTFIKLVSRYYDVNEGSIKINGVDIRSFTQDSLHQNIATIPQDVCLFNRTLFDNIRYGKTVASEAEVVAAAKKASADEFIRAFPNGYQTKVGERGVVLSGGERQRIAIARAILKNAPILIFDEATSALDSRSEKHIQKSLKVLMKNKTVIAVAHRLSTLREMDRIVVFEHGRIVEQGTHLGLLRRKGRYAKLYKMQSDGFVGITDKA